ncbi:hypothetical protein LHYA1_G001929 [Lachnellula hyalina]|uniref:SnoaL-like domain-containing protein n=1 Tax=Lachnellula hyalina TaxID=1316788 RepID=A0A8H8R4S0_9HELO|nr:uncharacterized protein LHYA1_G001929 [Lachnellula hyalina]TVY28577.1 hypothetical protein LHYA1_G001929 [Lachnellula hyalina]
MAFTLTREHVLSIFKDTANGNWDTFIEAIDPNVHWWISSDVKDPLCKSGIYNLQQWEDSVNADLKSHLKDGYLEMKLDSLDVIGLKAIAECSGFAVQNDGDPYQNRFAWFLVFSAETGKIVGIREYLHSALVKEMFSKK